MKLLSSQKEFPRSASVANVGEERKSFSFISWFAYTVKCAERKKSTQ